MQNNLDRLYDALTGLLDPQMESIMHSLATSDSSRSEFMALPEQDVDRLSPQEVSRLIALSANKYSNACRLASMARAKFKIAEGKYKLKFRTNSKDGRNEAEREANAMAASETEYHEMILAQVVVELCEGIESANRVASESSRRMLLASEQAWKAEGRFADHESALTSRDFNNI